MKKVIYPIVNENEITSTVYETKRQKDILDTLDNLLENAEFYDWFSVFDEENFYIEYKDGSTYEAGEGGEYGTYKKRNISRIIYTNSNDTQVYGDYEVNEYGIVS